MPGSLSESILEKIIVALSKAIWNRPELHALREPIETTLQTYEFKQLTRNTLFTFYERYQGRIPEFLDDGFIQQGPVQDELAKFIIEGREANLDELFRRYRDYVKGEEAEAWAAMEDYLRAVRGEFANHPHYGPILLARDMQAMSSAVNNLRHDIHQRFDELVERFDMLLEEPEVKALVERRQGRHVFLSYSQDDLTTALKLRNLLEDAGHRVWQDATAIKTGDDWIASIEDGIERSYAVVTLVSTASNESKWVKIEYLHAERRHKQIFPVKIDDCEIPTMMLADNVAMAYPDFETGFNKLLAELPSNEQKSGSLPAVSEQTQREREIAYLDRLLLQHSRWETLYTPMAGMGKMRPRSKPDNKPTMVTGSSRIESIFRQRMRESAIGRHPELPLKEKEYDDILGAIKDLQRLVVLGDPGAGKTTTLWRITAKYAEYAKKDPAAPLPVLIDLGALKADQDVEAVVKDQLGALADAYDDLMANNRLLFLFDGLNEMPGERRAEHVSQLKHVVARCEEAGMMIIVTCREHDYSGVLDLQIPEKVVITPLDPVRIQRFVNGYIEKPPQAADALFWELAGETAEDNWKHFQEAVGELFETFWLDTELPDDKRWDWGSDNPVYRNVYWKRWIAEREQPRSMLQLATNPYMLYMITQVYTDEGELPPNRGALFDLFVDFLLLDREEIDETIVPTLKDQLSNLAYEMQQTGEEGTTFNREQVLKHIDSQNLYHARSASLVSGDTEISFTHQLLQEYFAARKLDEMMKAGKSATDLWFPDNWWEPTGWEETAILLAGLYSDDPTPVVNWLKDAQPELAARCILESGAKQPPQETLNDLQERWRPRLTDLNRDPQPHACAAVGRGIGMVQLDDRPGVGLDENGLPDFDWIPVAGGQYTLGGDAQARNPLDEMTVNIESFYMACYPVTYAQFEVFVDDDGYTNEKYWTKAGWTWKGNKTHPEVYWQDERWHVSNHPVVGVTWYEAYAFTRWATVKLGYDIALPDQYQWEAAARGKERRIFAYSGDFDPAKCNVSATEMRRTSPVGIFPNGTTLDGIYDLTGNVWEWCLSQFDDGSSEIEGTNRRVIHGGSWDDGSVGARAASRSGSLPYDGDLNLGFRVVCASPNSPSDR